jgi:glycerol-3-phosphate dehydrogenase
MYDYIIIGSGVIGSLIARELSRYEASILVLEKENDLATHQTMANSAIIHSGHDPKPESLKAKLCVEGNRMYHDLKKELDVPLLYTGAFVVAHDDKEENMLQELYVQAKQNGVPDVAIIDQDQARIMEPKLASSVTKVLSLPTTMVTFSWEVALAAMENALKNGATYQKNAEVTHIQKVDQGFEITVNHDIVLQAKHVINAAGVMSDLIANMIEPDFEVKITPRRGEYFVIDKKAEGLFKRVIYPLPTEKGKGVLIVPQVHGNLLLGPTSELVGERENVMTTREGLAYIKEHLSYLSDQIPYHQIIRTFAGVRATSTYGDFYIKESKNFPGLYHLAGIDSPGLTAAPAIAKYLVEHVMHDLPKMKTNFNPIRRRPLSFRESSDKMRLSLIEKNPKYGKIVCRCEHVSEQEIIDAIHHPVGSDTIKGIKKRTRAGSGLCQGGYCESTVLGLIAQEKGIPLHKVMYDAKDSPILVKETKIHEND